MATVWNKRKSTRYLWSSLVITTFVLCAVFLYKSFSFGKQYGFAARSSKGHSTRSEKITEEECISVCNSEECLYQSNILLNNVQPEIDPCDNFYKFACGKFLEKNSPDEISTFGTRNFNTILSKLRGILDNLEASPKSASGKMKIAYDSCMKYSSDFQAVPTILQTLNSSGIQSWPHLVPDFKFVDYSLARVIGNLLLFQEYGFVKFSVGYEYRDTNSQINMTVLTGENLYEKNEQSLRKYQVDRILSYFDLDTEAINEIWEDSEAINDAIINLRQESERIDDENENGIFMTFMTMDCTPDGGSEWRDICESLKAFIDITGSDKKVNKNHANIQGNAFYFTQNIFPMLGNFSDRSVAHFLALNVFLNHMNDLNFYFRLTHQKDPKAHDNLDDQHDPIGRWQHCVKWIVSHMGLPLAHEYTKKDFTITMAKEVQNLTRELIQETTESLSRQKWMSEDVLRAMIEKIGSIFDATELYMNIFSNESFANRFYEEFYPVDGSFLHNVLEYRKFTEEEEMRGRKIMDILHMQKEIFKVDASGGGGEIVLHLGILLPPTYTPRFQRLINLVSLGIIIVHEIGHNVQTFFGEHMEFDQGARDYYFAQSQCIENQYSQFRFESIGKNLNGSRYSTENDADNMAIQVIDKLIERYVSNGEEISLPAFPYSTKQMLYISAAQAWCSIYTKEKDEKVGALGTHSPAYFRMLGMMQNSKGFSEAFNCPTGSYMNPSTKCLFFTD